jgi:transcriptional regulator with XRE-family HTH domain
MDAVYGLGAEEIAERTGVDVSTARRWKSGATRIPKAAGLILQADLGCFSPEWSGWRLDGQDLVSPEGWRIARGQVLSVPLMRQQLAAYATELRARDAAQVAALDEQPLPENWDSAMLA